MDITDFLPFYPDVDNAALQDAIYRKKEFFDNKLEPVEPIISAGESRKLAQQLIVERFFSEYTPYDEGLIYHAMGTGKTCAAFSLTESLKNKGTFKRCIVLAAGSDSLDNLRRELITRCSQDYKLDDTSGLSPEEILRKTRKLVKKFYRFETYYGFSKDVSMLSDEAIERMYNKTIFIVDEAHNIQDTNNETAVKVYQQIFRAFHIISARKILLLTGTPMRNGVEEFAALMNLILPMEKQLTDFRRRFFEEQKDATLTVRDEKVLKEILRGRISYLADPKFDIEIKWEGNVPKGEPDVPQFRSLILQMSKEQTKIYEAAYKEDTSGEGGDFYLNSIQASLFTFPDGSWGEEGRVKYFEDDNFLDSLEDLETLRRYSVKYAHVIETLEANRDKNVFIYCSSIQGSGLEMLAMVLRIYGYAPFSAQNSQTFGKRYMLLTSRTKNIGELVREFNRPRNKTGSYCQVILGSRKIAEGYSFKSIQIEMLLTQHWNEAETAQASRRGARFGSWNAFRREDGTLPPNMYLSIAKVCAVPAGKRGRAMPAIDLIMLTTSLKKDISIKRLDRVIKEVAFDCPLTFERNYDAAARDGSRECDYMECEYKCDAAAPNDGGAGGTDIVTYELYYDNHLDLVPRILSIFARNDILSITTLFEAIKPLSMMQLLKALVYIIENNITIFNRYGVQCFLRESRDMYYVTSDIATPISSLEYCYMSKPILTRRISLEGYLKHLSVAKAVETLEGLGEVKEKEDVARVLSQLEPEIIDVLLKLTVKESVMRAQNTVAAAILSLYKTRVSLKKAGKYIAVYKDTNDVTWCLTTEGVWRICVAKRKKWAPASGKLSVEETKEEQEALEYQQRIEQYGFEGVVGGEKFCIRKVQKGDIADRRKLTTGAVCQQAGWKKSDLLELVQKLKIPGAAAADKKDAICDAIEAWFKEKKIVRRGKCGTARKRKE